MTKQIIPIPWKNFPIPLEYHNRVVTVLYTNGRTVDWSWAGNIEVTVPAFADSATPAAWCLIEDGQKALRSQIPEPPLPEIIKPKWAMTQPVLTGPPFAVDLGGHGRTAAETRTHFWSGGLQGPYKPTEREAIEAWNELVK